MTSGRQGDLPSGIPGLCFLALRFLDKDATSLEIRQWLVRRSTEISTEQVRSGLHTLSHRKPPLARMLEERSKTGSGRPGKWRLTKYGRNIFAVKIF